MEVVGPLVHSSFYNNNFIRPKALIFEKKKKKGASQEQSQMLAFSQDITRKCLGRPFLK